LPWLVRLPYTTLFRSADGPFSTVVSRQPVLGQCRRSLQHRPVLEGAWKLPDRLRGDHDLSGDVLHPRGIRLRETPLPRPRRLDGLRHRHSGHTHPARHHPAVHAHEGVRLDRLFGGGHHPHPRHRVRGVLHAPIPRRRHPRRAPRGRASGRRQHVPHLPHRRTSRGPPGNGHPRAVHLHDSLDRLSVAAARRAAEPDLASGAEPTAVGQVRRLFHRPGGSSPRDAAPAARLRRRGKATRFRNHGRSSERLMARGELADRFPKGFLWGAATAAAQIEGAAHEGGKEDSIWDVYARERLAVASGDTPEVAVDHYHRMPADVALMKSLGLQSYRFSTSWARVKPGDRYVNEEGLDFYSRLVDELLEADILPWLTLYHWDLPQALQERGGWTNRDTAHRFADYAEAVYARLGDR